MSSPIIDKRLAEYVLERATPESLIGEALELIDRSGGEFCVEAGEAIAAQLASRLSEPTDRQPLLTALEARDSAMARFVRARLLAYEGQTPEAVEGFGRTLHALARPNAQVLLHRARHLARQKRFAEAAAELRLGLQLFPSYTFFVKSEQLLAKIIASGQWQPRRRVRLAVLASSTTALLAPVLRAAAFRDGLSLEIYQGAHSNYQQDILDSASPLYAFQPEVALILVNHRDVAIPPAGGLQAALDFAARLQGLWETLRQRCPCHIVQVGVDVPFGGAWGSLEYGLPEGRRRALHALNLALTQQLPAGVSVVDANAVAAEIGEGFWSDAEWHTARQYPSTAALPRLADYVCAHCAAALGLSAKVLAMDLDNTLWGGVIGEDLLHGIRIGAPSAEGEGYLELQKYVKQLQERGVLLAVCSKNNQADAELPFREHDAMHLKLADFAAFAASWQDKPTSLAAVADELSLGLESVVFLDDNPMERAMMRSRLPQVTVPECGGSPWEMLAALRRGLYFESVAISDEDLQRHASYRGNAERRALEKNAATLTEFLVGLEMKAQHGPVDAKTLVRVAQLVNKTNQFNLTARRYTEEQIRAMAESPEWWCRWFRLADRFGDQGLIGVLLAEKSETCWRIDTWLMSCRVLGRRMEDFMGRTILVAAQRDGAAEVLGEYVQTARNGLVKNLYQQIGFQPAGEGQRRFVFRLGEQAILSCDLIDDLSATK